MRSHSIGTDENHPGQFPQRPKKKPKVAFLMSLFTFCNRINKNEAVEYGVAAEQHWDDDDDDDAMSIGIFSSHSFQPFSHNFGEK